ncbi:ATP-binding protein [Streptomyces boninensis]|uniref:ATP-binding protein n=1 Tax=Streptomyces boninensis TaxID=2039455 RepID=UPI003B219275
MAFGSTWRRGDRLPAEVTSFVGRTAELADVQRLLAQARMVTLVGPGGVGKTRLALRSVAEASARFADGVHLVELSGLKGAELLPNAVSEALGLPEQAGRPQVDAVVEYVAERELLLVLDTCEHLLDACALLADLLLPQAPRLTILATSRQALDVPGEHVLPVPPLPLPEAEGDAVEGALELFVQRARAAVPGFRLNDANRAHAVALCRRLDGIPLAIELASVRLRALPLDHLVARLTDTFALLAGSRLTTLPRHQTLRTTIGWSHELCTPPERLLWARLSVFAGDFDLSAAEAVCADAELPVESVLEHLISLVDKSVVLRVGEQGTRYRLLDTIREFGAEWLTSLGEQDAVRERHIACYRARLMQLGLKFTTSEQPRLHRELAAEEDNLRAALEYAIERGEVLRMTLVMSAYWAVSGRPAEAAHWMEKGFGDHPGSHRKNRAWNLAMYAMFAGHQGTPERAITAAQEALELAAEFEDDAIAALGAGGYGVALSYRGDHEEALEQLRFAEEKSVTAGHPLPPLMSSLGLSVAHVLARRPDEAIAECDRTIELLGPGSGECFIQGFSYVMRGLAHFMCGRPDLSAAALRRAAGLQSQRGDVLGLAHVLSILAWLAVDAGRHRRAAWLFGAASTHWSLVGRTILLGNPMMQSMQEKSVAATRSALGEERYAQLFEQGVRLPSQRAIDFAAGDQDALPPDPPAYGDRAASRADALTRREREVAALVAQGLSNREIAERLVISKRTADAHVEHILAKLGFSSRSEIAAMVSGAASSRGTPPDPHPGQRLPR